MHLGYYVEGNNVIAENITNTPKIYKHILNSSYIRENGERQDQRLVVYSYIKEPYTASNFSIKLTNYGFLSAYLFRGYGYGDYSYFEQGLFSSNGMYDLVYFNEK
ncbi:MAG: hypothetical protein KBS91_00435, partial [Firmicutes bacterium]|nr:hypothetical protein [Candidatus Caballimonas caccae]